MTRYFITTAAVLGILSAGCSKRATTIALDPGSANVSASSDAVAQASTPVPVAVAPAAVIGQAFPEGAEGKLLVDKLKPAEVGVPARETRDAPLAVRPPKQVEKPEPPLPEQRAELQRGELARIEKPVRPYLLPGEPPLAREVLEPALPQRIFLIAVAPPVRVPSLDVEKMQPLPYLSDGPAADAASSVDPTAGFSRNLALTTQAPPRANPAPFQRLELPDPFRDRATVQLKVVPAESTSPSSPEGKKP
ncbi:MAG: hypothetical protein AB7K24_08250 [Gemmataceae bacterium]